MKGCPDCERKWVRRELREDDHVNVCLCHQERPVSPAYVHVEISDVRAADGIRIRYDFERDGWVIQQASRFGWSGCRRPECDTSDWQEVAFVQAWGRAETPEQEDARIAACIEAHKA